MHLHLLVQPGTMLRTQALPLPDILLELAALPACPLQPVRRHPPRKATAKKKKKQDSDDEWVPPAERRRRGGRRAAG